MNGYDTVPRRAPVHDVPEEPTLYYGLTAEQYLQFVRRARGLGKQVQFA
jgi:ABC-type multidrug transport system ATPase subunit